MIESAIGYKFRDHIKETVLYEDQVVEHVLTGHVAERRVFPKRLSQDNTALDMVKKQLKLAASIEHPNLPSIYGASTTEGQYLYIQQHFEGETLELLAQRKNAQKAKDWIQVAARLVDLCIGLQFNGVAFDRLSLADIIISNRMLLISRRYPVGKTSEEAQSSSLYLSRLFESSTSGIYHSEGRFPTQACLNNLKIMLFQLACSMRFSTIEEARDHIIERDSHSSRKSPTKLGIDHNIEDIILRLDNESGLKTIRSIDELKIALREFDVDKAEPKISVSTTTVPKQNTSKSESDNLGVAFPDGNPLDNQESEKKTAASRESSAVLPPAPAKKKQEEKPRSEPKKDLKSDDTKMIGHDLDQDADEDRSYLYPSKSGSDSDSDIKKKSSSNVFASPDEISKSSAAIPIKKRKQAIKIPWIFVIPAIVVAGLIYLIITILPYLSTEANTAPVANIRIEGGNTTLPTQEFIVLDATSSTDEEENPLTYNWSLPNVEDKTDYLIEYIESDRSIIQIKFFQQGAYPVQLIVFDGQFRSQPADITLEVFTP